MVPFAVVRTDMAETASVETEESDVRRGPQAAIPEMPLAEWFTERAEEYSDLPAAHVKHDGEYGPITFAELHEEARQVAGGLLETGLEPGDRIAVRSETRFEWSVVDVACLLSGLVLVPVYPTFSPKQASYVVENAGADVLVTEETEVPREIANATEEVLDIADLPKADLEGTPGAERDGADLATMIYTSGTTGDPKGVEITHRNLMAEMNMIHDRVPDMDPGKKGTCFLPLSHVYQRAANYFLWDNGHSAVFMSPDTLLEDLKATEPHLMSSVPRVYRRMYDGLQDQVSEMGAPKARLVRWAMGVAREYGRTREAGGPDPSPGLRARHAIADRLVFSTLREQFGLTNVEFAITGAASLDAGILRFFWGMGVPLLEGYGATETTAGVTFNDIDGFRAGTVGEPLPETEVKLAPDGEVLVRGPTVMRGYWKLSEETEASLQNDWYHTGDVGEWDGDYLKIIDRKKHMQVLDTGKNVYSDPIEETLRRQASIAEALVVADDRKYVTALLQPNFDALLNAADGAGIDYDESAVETDGDETVRVPADLVEHPEVQALYEDEIEAANEELAEYERVQKFRLIHRAFSVEQEELTPTLKKRRRDISDNFEEEIESMYEA